MKKVLAVLAIAGTLVACNNDSETTISEDTTSITVDTNTTVTPITVDTTTVVDTTGAAADTTAK